MRENSFISIRNGVIASVIAGIILLIIPVFRGYVIKFILWLWSVLIWCWNALISSYSLPGWAWFILFILALVSIINIYSSIKGKTEEPEFKKYVEDLIFGAKWRWKWVDNRISNLWCYCPHCEAILVYDDSSCRSILLDVNKTDFLCEHCGNIVVATIAGGNKSYAIGAVGREIDRRIRTGQYKKH
ncbi:MAG: hypothetical protein WAU61_03575 [Smithella sp.]